MRLLDTPEFLELKWLSQGHWRWVGRVGNSDQGQLPIQVLADQLNLYQQEGADCASPNITTCPPISR